MTYQHKLNLVGHYIVANGPVQLLIDNKLVTLYVKDRLVITEDHHDIKLCVLKAYSLLFNN